MADAKKMLGKGLAIATLVAAAVALAHALKKNKKAKLLKAAMLDAKAAVIAHAKKLKGVSKKSYAKIVDTVMAEYRGMKTLSKEEMAELSGELKEGWREIDAKLRAHRR